MSEITDYGSLHNVLSENPKSAASSEKELMLSIRKEYVTNSPIAEATFLLTSNFPSVPTLPRTPATTRPIPIKNIIENAEYI